MSRVPSLKDILENIQDDVSDSDEGEFETIEPQKSVQRKPMLDIPDEYKVLNKPKVQEHQVREHQVNEYVQYNKDYNNYNNNYNQVYQNVRGDVILGSHREQNVRGDVKKENKPLQLTEANLMKVSGESMISYDIPKYESIETKSIKSKKSEKSHKSHTSKKSNKSESSIDFSVGDDNQNRHISYDYDNEDDDRRSQISSLSAGSIKSRVSYVEKEVIKPFIKKHDIDQQSIISKISKKSHISISSMSSMGTSIQSTHKSVKSDKPLIQSSYPKRVEQSPMAFDKFSNQNTEEVEAKVDVKRIKNIEEFKAKINHYIKLDDEIKTLSDALRERRKEKQRFEGELLNFMKQNDISSIKNKQDNSQIELVQKKKTETLSKEYLMSTLLELLRNKSTAENITNYVYSKRGVVETEKIKRVVEGKSKKNKKDKY